MAITPLQLLVTSLLLLPVIIPSAIASEEVPKLAQEKVEVVVETMVYCQSCDQFGKWTMIDAKPVSSAKVSITCKNQKGQVNFYKVFQTDANGYLYASLEGFKMGYSLLDHPLHSCYVKPVWSPLENCNLLSNVNYGLNGAPLRYESKKLRGRNYEAVIYSAGPLAFRPSSCPHTTHV